jgi:hypothetical protein
MGRKETEAFGKTYYISIHQPRVKNGFFHPYIAHPLPVAVSGDERLFNGVGK